MLPSVGGIAGYGAHSEIGLPMSAFWPIDLCQTMNTAELFAAIQAFSATASTKVAICTDFPWVYSGSGRC